VIWFERWRKNEIRSVGFFGRAPLKGWARAAIELIREAKHGPCLRFSAFRQFTSFMLTLVNKLTRIVL
jgi:hypothetical protein